MVIPHELVTHAFVNCHTQNPFMAHFKVVITGSRDPSSPVRISHFCEAPAGRQGLPH